MSVRIRGRGSDPLKWWQRWDARALCKMSGGISLERLTDKSYQEWENWFEDFKIFADLKKWTVEKTEMSKRFSGSLRLRSWKWCGRLGHLGVVCRGSGNECRSSGSGGARPTGVNTQPFL